MGAGASTTADSIKEECLADAKKPLDASDLNDGELRGEVQRLRNNFRKVVEIHTNASVKNDEPITSPVEPNLLDNCLLFLPLQAVQELGLEPNMDDKGDKEKELWAGRVWELRALLAAQYQKRISKVKNTKLTPEDIARLDALMSDPEKKKMVVRMGSTWKGVAFRRRCSLSILERLKWANLKGTLIYAHGSGGCSWDNYRICRMICKMGMLVIAPDDFAYPQNSAMGMLRHKGLQPLKKATDNCDYWAGDLIYSTSASGDMTYSTKADKVLDNPDSFRDMYEKCYQLRRSELHFIILRLPQWIKTMGFFLGGTSEGAMTIARFDDQRYGEQVCGRFINSFGMEYCYFTPTVEAGKLGGQLDVPTVNIIGTKDEFFGPIDSVAKIVVEDEVTGYGDKQLDGNGYNTMIEQGVDCGLVCVLEDGVHSPSNTHDNFLRPLFQTFFTRPGQIWELDAIWDVDDMLTDLVTVTKRTDDAANTCNVTNLFVPKMKFPQKLTLREVEALHSISQNFDEDVAEMMKEEMENIEKDQAKAKAMLDGVRQGSAKGGGSGFPAKEVEKKNFYQSDKQTVVKHKMQKHH